MSFNITVEASGRISFIKRYKDNLSFGVLGSKMEYPYPSNEEFKQMVISHKDKLGYICPIRICQDKTYSLLEKAQVQGRTIKVVKYEFEKTLVYYQIEYDNPRVISE